MIKLSWQQNKSVPLHQGTLEHNKIKEKLIDLNFKIISIVGIIVMQFLYGKPCCFCIYELKSLRSKGHKFKVKAK